MSSTQILAMVALKHVLDMLTTLTQSSWIQRVRKVMDAAVDAQATSGPW